jgi:molybdate transport system substrate-binding protein
MRARGRMLAAVTGLLMVLGIVAGCSSADDDESGGAGSASEFSALTGEIVVFAAASLTGTFTEIGKQFEAAHPGVTVTFSFAGSSDLATSINGGAPGDVFASASNKTMTTVVDAGNAEPPTDFATNIMEIVTPSGNPKKIQSLADLTKPGVTVAICKPGVPCGDAATALFKAAGVAVTPVTLEADVKATLAKVSNKEVDAGIVYVTDVKAAGDDVAGVEIAESENYVTTYPIATLTETDNPEAAEAFVDYVLSEDGQQVLKEAGFLSA